MINWKMPVVILVEGLISAGKSTLISKCLVPQLEAKGLRVRIIKEPVDKWVDTGILQKFYADPTRWGYSFQTKAFHDRIMEAINVYTKERADVYLMERSPYSDHIFMTTLHENKNVSDMEYDMYKEWWSLWHKLLPFTPDMILYLKTTVENCMERLKIRNRDGESGVSKEYQQQLLSHHDRLFDHDKVTIGPYQVECRPIDGNQNFIENPGLVDSIVQAVLLKTIPTRECFSDVYC